MRYIKTLLISLTIMFMNFSFSQAKETLALKDFLNKVYKNNHDLVVARQELTKEEYKLNVARAARYPSISASGSYGQSGNYADRNSDSKSLGLSVRQTLYAGGTISAEIKETKFNLEIKQEEYKKTQQQIFLAAKEIFYKVLQEMASIELINKVVERRRENMVLIRLKYKSGCESFASLSQAEADFLASEFDKKNSYEKLRLAKTELNLMIGEEASVDLAIQEEDSLVTFPEYQASVSQAYHLRSEIKQAELKEELLKLQVAKIKSEYWPNLSCSASHGFSGEDNIFAEKSWRVGVDLSVPLFKGFTTPNKLKQAELDLDIQKQKKIQLKKEINLEVDQAYTNYLLSKEKKAVVLKSLQAMQDIFKITKLSYKQGKTSYFNLQNYEYDLTKAENSCIEAHYNYLIAAARLLAAIGIQEETN